jgi:nitrogen-specific signal transduction histidine kinase
MSRHNYVLYICNQLYFIVILIVMEEKTYFAPAKRSSEEEIIQENQAVSLLEQFAATFGAMTGIGAILNINRQIIYANKEFLEFIGLNSLEPVLGKRPGEVVSCIHSKEEAGGCGTSMSCAYCGAVNAIMESQKTQRKTERETTISSIINGKQVSIDLNVTSTPINLGGQVFYVLSLKDTSSEKKLLALERVFFHDLLNTAGGLNGLLTILKMGTDPAESHELICKSEEASQSIIDEIMSFRQLRAAEKGDIQMKIEELNSIEFINTTIGRIASHEVGQNKQILLDNNSADINFQSDRILLQRVLINLLKNALESTLPGGNVVVGFECEGQRIKLWVRNSGVIPSDVQMQIFQRSFSTKGKGRGIGTYSIRLLTENYLKGKAGFVSNETEGTIFSVELYKYFPS